MYDELIRFITETLNQHNKHTNAIAYDEQWLPKAVDTRIEFQNRNMEQYVKVLEFCSNSGMIVISTNPATLATVVRARRGDINE